MITSDVYEMLVKDIEENTTVSVHSAREVVDFLESEGILDYDLLKELYLYFDNDDEDDDEDYNN